ncbi:hypothetical protein COLO4_01331 [Corchorus olitorius]|uniref:Uncharacterized protein n=1 Tax=Corchorus olitorius TaxID=93759 RepID=A0A1R3L2U1_9ROSI|nr:hypothetical protein COLO4_01331 [Corchorus olitorius]
MCLEINDDIMIREPEEEVMVEARKEEKILMLCYAI